MIRNRALSVVRQQPQLIILVLLIVLFAIAVPEFFTIGNIMNVLKQNTTVSIVSCGLAFVVIGGNLDLSVGSLLSLTLGLSLSMTMNNTLLAILVPLGVSIAVGFANGYIVSRFNVSSIIVTLGSLSAISGFVQFYRKCNIIIIRANLYCSIPLHITICQCFHHIYVCRIFCSKTCCCSNS